MPPHPIADFVRSRILIVDQALTLGKPRVLLRIFGWDVGDSHEEQCAAALAVRCHIATPSRIFRSAAHTVWLMRLMCQLRGLSADGRHLRLLCAVLLWRGIASARSQEAAAPKREAVDGAQPAVRPP